MPSSAVPKSKCLFQTIHCGQYCSVSNIVLNSDIQISAGRWERFDAWRFSAMGQWTGKRLRQANFPRHPTRLDNPYSWRHMVPNGRVRTGENIGVTWLKPSYWPNSFRAVVCLLTIRKIQMFWMCYMTLRKISYRRPRILRVESDTPTASNHGRTTRDSELR